MKQLLIGVTRFFRERDAFAALDHKVVPHIFRDRQPGETVRVWVAACFTGGEPYSLAMLPADPPAIRTARAGTAPPVAGGTGGHEGGLGALSGGPPADRPPACTGHGFRSSPTIMAAGQARNMSGSRIRTQLRPRRACRWLS